MRHVTTRNYEIELHAEQNYVAGLYERLDAERARLKDKYDAALRAPFDKGDQGDAAKDSASFAS